MATSAGADNHVFNTEGDTHILLQGFALTLATHRSKAKSPLGAQISTPNPPAKVSLCAALVPAERRLRHAPLSGESTIAGCNCVPEQNPWKRPAFSKQTILASTSARSARFCPRRTFAGPFSSGGPCACESDARPLPKVERQDTLPEWSKGVDSSSTSASCVGSNPTGVIRRTQRFGGGARMPESRAARRGPRLRTPNAIACATPCGDRQKGLGEIETESEASAGTATLINARMDDQVLGMLASRD
jgi:hypothetical protein